MLLFENFERCHKSLLPMLAALCETGTLKLSTRYALQKGMLIDVGTALVPNAVSEIRRRRAVLRLYHRPRRGGVCRCVRRAVPLGGHGFLPAPRISRPESLR